MRDRKYTPGGTDHTDGNYEDDYSIGSRAGRIYMMESGNWVGGRGRKTGTRLHTLTKIDEHAHADAERMVREGFEPLTRTGEMGDLMVTPEFIPGRENALGNDVTWTDNTQGDSLIHEREDGRQG